MNTAHVKIEINIKSDNDYINICRNIPGVESRHQYGVYNFYFQNKQILHANIFANNGEGDILFYLSREKIIKLYMDRWALLEKNNEELSFYNQLEI
jgi:hypothetical protein